MSVIRNSALIVGDFSGVGTNLARELESIGFDVRLISDGDGYKSIGQVHKFNWMLRSPIGRYVFLLYAVVRSILNKYSFVIFVTPFVVKGPAWLCGIVNYLLLNSAEKSVFLACGSDAIWWNYRCETAGRTPHRGFLSDLGGKQHRFASKRYEIVNRSLADSVDRVVALGFEYVTCYRIAGYEVEYCGFPIVQDYCAVELNPEVKEREFCYHGVTRAGFKGSKNLIEFMRSNNHWGYRELITEKISFSSFVENLSRSSIYLDQWSSFGPAMAALEALKYCPVVISGFQSEFCDSKYAEQCPVIDPVQASMDPTLINHMLSDPEAISRARKFLHEFHSPSLLVDAIIQA